MFLLFNFMGWFLGALFLWMLGVSEHFVFGSSHYFCFFLILVWCLGTLSGPFSSI